jgi:hypothetical protein
MTIFTINNRAPAMIMAGARNLLQAAEVIKSPGIDQGVCSYNKLES